MAGTENVELAGVSWRAEAGHQVRVVSFWLVPLQLDPHGYHDLVAAAMRRYTPWGDWELHTEYSGERPDLEAAWGQPGELDLWPQAERLRRVDEWDGTFTPSRPLPDLLDPAGA